MAEEKDKKNKFQQRMDEQAAAMEKAYAELRETYDDPTDEQILAVAGNNLRGYQKKIGNKAGNWGTAFGSNALWGTLNKDTRAALEKGYQAGLKAQNKPLTARRAELLYTLGEGDGAKNVTKGMQMDARNWGDNIKDTDNITPEQVRKLNEIMTSGGFTNFTIPTQQVTTKNEKGEDVVTDVEQNISLYDLLESASPEEIEALEYLGFVDEDGAYVRPHNETFEEKLARKEREKERIDLLTQQKALQRQQARLGLADLAAGIGDIIKASGGALVDKRDYQDMYNRLTAQQQKNFDNYLARMEALKQEEKAKQKETADRARQERLLKEQRLYNEQLQQRQWEHDEEVLEQKHKNKLAEIKARGQQKLKEIGERYNNQIDKFNNAGAIVFDGTDYTFDKARNNNVISQLLPIVSNYFTEENGYISAIAGIEDSVMSEYGKAGERANIVLSALKDFEYQFSQEDRDNIIRILTEYSNSRKPVKSQVGGVTPVKPANAEQMYRNKETGEEVPKSEWDTYRPSKKELYEPVTA
jgi:hypothetical protein